MPEFVPDYLPDTRESFLLGYLTCAEWTEEVVWTDPDAGMPEAEAWSAEFIDRAERDCLKFTTENTALLEAAYARRGYNEERAGHDFWLTRNGRGAGFWDRRELEADSLGQKLTSAAKAFGELDTYVGDNGLIYGE